MADATPSGLDAAHLATEAPFRLLVESVKDYAIFILDSSGHVRTWNSGAERIKGYGADQIIGEHFSIFYPPDVAVTGKCELELEIACRVGRFEEEGWRLRRDGTRFWANVIITALRSPEGTLVGFAKVTRDLTMRRAAEEAERALAAERAASFEKARTQQFQERFLAILGHDLRNPLASLNMGMGLLRQRLADPMTVHVLDRMESSSRRMSRMIEQILDFTRVRLEGGMQLSREEIDLRTTLEAITIELSGAYPTRTITLSCPALVGIWDRDRLEQVFSNLIGNAILHGDAHAPVAVEVQVAELAIHVVVHNQGPPIPPALMASLFDPFRRGERDSRTAKTAGLGLGLYICRELILAHGGTLECSSSDLHGTTFRVSLPRAATRSRP